MKVLYPGFIALLLLARNESAVAQTPKNGVKPAPVIAAQSGNSAAKYAMRVRLVAQDLRWSLAELHLLWENYQTLQDLINQPRKDTDVPATREEQSRTKQRLLEVMKRVQSNATRLRSLSPVPRPFKRLDDKLIGAGLELHNGVQGISTWLLFPSAEVRNISARQLRHSQSTLEGALNELARRTEPAITRKIYAE
jgi:hypothetical protein